MRCDYRDLRAWNSPASDSATNLAEIIVGAGNPEGITDLADLAGEDLIVVQCVPEVPCGKHAPNADGARACIDDLLSEPGHTILASSGSLAP